MTERIKELANQSQKYAIEWLDESGELHKYYDVYFEKFAELIIKDIFNVMHDQKTYNRCTYTTHDLDKAHCIVEEVIKSVNQHFGTKL